MGYYNRRQIRVYLEQKRSQQFHYRYGRFMLLPVDQRILFHRPFPNRQDPEHGPRMRVCIYNIGPTMGHPAAHHLRRSRRLYCIVEDVQQMADHFHRLQEPLPRVTIRTPCYLLTPPDWQKEPIRAKHYR